MLHCNWRAPLTFISQNLTNLDPRQNLNDFSIFIHQTICIVETTREGIRGPVMVSKCIMQCQRGWECRLLQRGASDCTEYNPLNLNNDGVWPEWVGSLRNFHLGCFFSCHNSRSNLVGQCKQDRSTFRNPSEGGEFVTGGYTTIQA